MQQKYREVLEETWSTVHMTLGWVKGSPFNNLKHTANAMLRDKPLKVIEWPSQSPDLTPIEDLWSDMKIAIRRCSPTNMIELVETCQEE